jgi:ketopantoate reductase
MKILIVGTGVIGTIYGWALAESGNDVAHYVRMGKKETLKDGIKIHMLDERKGHPKDATFQYRPKCVEQVSDQDGYDITLVPVTNNKLEGALKELAPLLSKTQFLIFSSNWDGTGVVDRYLSRDRYMLGYPDGGGTFEDGGMIANLGPNVHLGEFDGSMSPRLKAIVDLFKKADMTPEIANNILHWLWILNATSVAIWAGFYRYGNINSFLKDNVLVKESFQATRECLDICRKKGVEVDKYDDISYFNYPIWLIVLIFKAMYRFNKSMKIYTAHAASEGSKLELMGNFLGVYESGKQLAVPMPYMEKLMREVKGKA